MLEIKYDENDLGLTLLCSLLILYFNILDTLNEIYDALYSKEKTKLMISNDRSISSQGEGLFVRGRSNERDH